MLSTILRTQSRGGRSDRGHLLLVMTCRSASCYTPVMLVVEKHAFLQEVQLGAVCRVVFGVVGFGAYFLTSGRFLELKLIPEERRYKETRHDMFLFVSKNYNY